MSRLAKGVASCCLGLWLIAGPPGPAAANPVDYAGHYETAIEARQAGDFALAVAELEAALTLRPDSVEALHLLGTVLAFEGRYDEALQRLARARTLDPDNLDVELAEARVLSWSGDYAAAGRAVSTILTARPDNLEARLLAARIAFYQGGLAKAEQHLAAVLAREPRNGAALLLLGDVKRAGGAPDAARDAYEQAAEIDPASTAVQERLEQTRTRPWRLDLGGNYSSFSREDRQDWTEGFLQLRREIGGRSGLYGRIDGAERFDQRDLQLTAGADHRVNDWLSGYAAAGGTPSADFLPRWMVSAGGSARLRTGDETLGATVLTFDYRHSDYDTGGVDSLSPGVAQHFLDGRIWVTGRWINTFNEDNDWTSGWLVRLDWQARDDLGLHAGLANAPETVLGETIDTFSYFAGVVYRLSAERSLRLDYLHDDREDSYRRNSFALSFSQRF